MESQNNQKKLFDATVRPRVFTRVPHRTIISYRDAAGNGGEGLTLNIGWGGLGVSLGRYLRPGTQLSVTAPPRNTEIRGAIAWCRPGEHGRFLAGLRLALDEVAALDALSALLLEALLSADAAEHAHSRRTVTPNTRGSGTLHAECVCCVA